MANYCITEKAGREYSKATYLKVGYSNSGVLDSQLPVTLNDSYKTPGATEDEIYYYNNPIVDIEDFGDYLSIIFYLPEKDNLLMKAGGVLRWTYYRYVSHGTSTSEQIIQYRIYKDKKIAVLRQIDFGNGPVVFVYKKDQDKISEKYADKRGEWSTSATPTDQYYGKWWAFSQNKDYEFNDSVIIINSDTEAKATAFNLTKTVADNFIKSLKNVMYFPRGTSSTFISRKMPSEMSREITQFFDISNLTSEEEKFIFEKDGTRKSKTDPEFFISLTSLFRYLCIKPALVKKVSARISAIEKYVDIFGGDVDNTLSVKNGGKNLRIGRKEDNIIFYYPQDTNRLSQKYTYDTCKVASLIIYNISSKTYKMFRKERDKVSETTKIPVTEYTMLHYIYRGKGERAFRVSLYGAANLGELFDGTLVGECFKPEVYSKLDNCRTFDTDSTRHNIRKILEDTGKDSFSLLKNETHMLPSLFIPLLAAESNQILREAFYAKKYNIFLMLLFNTYYSFYYNIALPGMATLGDCYIDENNNSASVEKQTCYKLNSRKLSVIGHNIFKPGISFNENFGGASEEQLKLIDEYLENEVVSWTDFPIFSKFELIANKKMCNITVEELKYLCPLSKVIRVKCGHINYLLMVDILMANTVKTTAKERVEYLLEQMDDPVINKLSSILYDPDYADKMGFLKLLTHQTVLFPFNVPVRLPEGEILRVANYLSQEASPELKAICADALGKEGIKISKLKDSISLFSNNFSDLIKGAWDWMSVAHASGKQLSVYDVYTKYPKKIISSPDGAFKLITPRSYDDIIRECCAIGIFPYRIFDYIYAGNAEDRKESPVLFVRKASNPKEPYGILVNDDTDGCIAFLTTNCLGYKELPENEKIPLLKALIGTEAKGDIKLHTNFIPTNIKIILGGK